MSVHLEPAARAFAEATALPPYLFDLGPVRGRAVVDEVQNGPVPEVAAEITGLSVDGGPSGPVPVRIVRPPHTRERLPVIVYVHGVGWVFGNGHTHDRLVRELAVGVRAAVVFPHYSLSPEARYPTAIEESYAATAWVAKYGADHGLDPGRIAVAGDGVGANIVIAMSLLASPRGGISFRKRALFYPQ